MNILENLNDKQISAVVNSDGPTIIIAGAGVGKTRVLTHKIAYLISVLKVQSYRILALTFTNKSAKEMRIRVAKLLENDHLKTNVFTYHALCAKILRIDANYLNLNNNFNIIDVDDQKKIIRDIYQKKYDTKVDVSEIRLIISNISQWKNQHLTQSDIIADYYEQKDWVLRAHVFANYQKYQKENNCVDFDDLLLLVEKLFDQFPEVLEKWQSKFDFILVDEFQDTNDLQYKILRLLAVKHNNLTVVGDPDQTIYSWRGANINLILRFTQMFKEAKTFILDQNYRSTTKILETANSLIKINQRRIKKDLFTKNNLGEDIIVFHARTSTEEANWVAAITKNLHKKNFSFNQIAILYRNNYLSRDLEQAFINFNINYKIVGGFKFYERKEIKDVVAYLKVIAWNDNLSMLRILSTIPKVGNKTIDSFISEAEMQNLQLSKYLITNYSNLSKNHQLLLQPTISLISDFQNKIESLSSIHELTEEILHRSNYLVNLRNNFESERIENVKQLLSQMLEYDSNNNSLEGNELLNNFLIEVSLYTNSDEETAIDAVNFMTIHSAKGLEFDVVFIIGINEGILPGLTSQQSLSSKEEERIEEERRLLYVAITRAKKMLLLSSSSGFSYVLNKQTVPSRFFSDLEDQHLNIINAGNNWNQDQNNKFTTTQNQSHNANKISNVSQNTNKWKINDQIIHEIFGLGIVLKVLGDKIQVAFNQKHGGIKIINSNHPAIIKKNEK